MTTQIAILIAIAVLPFVLVAFRRIILDAIPPLFFGAVIILVCSKLINTAIPMDLWLSVASEHVAFLVTLVS